ncbi:MAG: hypothetical protein O7D29_01695 [Gemmatimonadetes bacterium]|nr:hypothetical protein [Gemmatimonadota bacterium]
MNPEDRREFIKKIAKGMVYSAPVIASLAAPKPVMASHKPGHTGMGGGMMSAPATFSPAPVDPASPGAIPPPGAR